MIRHHAFPVEPWCVRETELHTDLLAQSESLFALANGHLGLRGNLDEGEPAGIPGTYLAGFYEQRPLPYAEPGYGYPEAGETLVNVTNGKIVRLLVEDEPFDLRCGQLISHERLLDLRGGVLRRTVRWLSPTGRRIRVRSERLVSLRRRANAVIRYEIEPLDGPLPVVVQSEMIANEELPPSDGDPRAASAGARLLGEEAIARGSLAVLVHRTETSGLRVGAGMDHLVEGPGRTDVLAEAVGDLARVCVACDLAPGKPLKLTKFLAYGWSESRTPPAIRDQVVAALASAMHSGWQALLEEQREHLDAFWSHADLQIEGDPELQQAARFALFHLLQAGARGEQRPIPAKGLTGPGYDGHTFWDTESFVLQVLTYTAPNCAADALGFRHRTLDAARERARVLGLRGSSFPWRTITGSECSGYWPAATAAFHVNADIADAVARYQYATGDVQFEQRFGLELLVETARLWRSLGHLDRDGVFRIDGVTGPDEYSAVADNNLYTNLMAQRNLLEAAESCARHPEHAAQLGVDEGEVGMWRDLAAAVHIPFDRSLGVHEQSEGFTRHEAWDFSTTRPGQYPLMFHFPYFQLYRKQVVKQADLVLAMHLRSDAFTLEQKARNFGHYERITVRDSSLSACTQAVLAAELGHMELSRAYLRESALIDLEDLERNTRDGLHAAALAGTWLGAVAGFGGMRDGGGRLSFAPRLPPGITRMAFKLRFRERLLEVEVTGEEASYALLSGRSLRVLHHGEELELTRSATQRRAIPAPPSFEAPSQPAGRAPAAD